MIDIDLNPKQSITISFASSIAIAVLTNESPAAFSYAPPFEFLTVVSLTTSGYGSVV